MARFTPFTEAMEIRSAWCDTNERREWGGSAVRSTLCLSLSLMDMYLERFEIEVDSAPETIYRIWPAKTSLDRMIAG